MDEYGSFRHTKEDAKEIAESLSREPAVVFSYSHNQVDAIIVILAKQFEKLGVMPFGGNPQGRIYCGIYGRGCAHLSLDEGTHYSYLDEKLNIRDQKMAENFSIFYGWILNELKRKVK